MAAHALHAQVADPSAHTAPARKAFNERFMKLADPDGSLSPAERARRAEHLRRAYYIKLAIKSADARRRNKPAKPADARAKAVSAAKPVQGPV